MKRKALVVDNEDSVRTFLARTLTQAGYDVAQASDGAGTEAALASEAPDSDLLLVMDVALEAESGLDLGVDLAHRFPRISIVFISGFADDVLLMNDSGIRGRTTFLQKPFTPETLLASIDRLALR